MHTFNSLPLLYHAFVIWPFAGTVAAEPGAPFRLTFHSLPLLYHAFVIWAFGGTVAAEPVAPFRLSAPLSCPPGTAHAS